MSMPYYVSPEQQVKDRAEFAQKGIARGRSLIGAVFTTGVVIVAENPSTSLNKISEIYDRMAFAGVGKYNEYDRLREAGIRWADSTGFSYSREDVEARALANYYAQHLGDIFAEGHKPYEVEILVAQLGVRQTPTKLYHIAYEGTITDEVEFAVLGGDAEAIRDRFRAGDSGDGDLPGVLRRAVLALSGTDRTIPSTDLEIAVLQDHGSRRTFRRVSDGETDLLLGR
jgi:proteasome alpha subunit